MRHDPNFGKTDWEDERGTLTYDRLTKMNLREGDVIFVHIDIPNINPVEVMAQMMSHRQFVETLGDAIEVHKGFRPMFLFLPSSDEANYTAITEAQMIEHGYVPIEKVKENLQESIGEFVRYLFREELIKGMTIQHLTNLSVLLSKAGVSVSLAHPDKPSGD